MRVGKNFAPGRAKLDVSEDKFFLASMVIVLGSTCGHWSQKKQVAGVLYNNLAAMS